MFSKFFRVFGYVPASSAPAYQTIEAGRPMSDVEAQCRIRNLLADSRFKFRKLSTLAEATGRMWGETDRLIATMPDIRGSRDNDRREPGTELFTFADSEDRPSDGG